VEPSLSCSMSGSPAWTSMAALKAPSGAVPRLPVIMMSGHAGIEAAVTTIKAGAYDFLEKPLHLEVLLDKVASALKHRPAGRGAETAVGHGVDDRQRRSVDPCRRGGSGGFPRTAARTLKGNVVLNGIGLLSGRNTGASSSPPSGRTRGSSFSHSTVRPSGGTSPPSRISPRPAQSKTFSANSTTLDNGRRRVRTVEHLMAVLSMYGITNVLIKVDEEIPNVERLREGLLRPHRKDRYRGAACHPPR